MIGRDAGEHLERGEVGERSDRAREEHRVDVHAREQLTEYDGHDPGQRAGEEDGPILTLRIDRECAADAARDEEQDEHPGDEEALRPELKKSDERDRDESRHGGDEPLPDGLWREREAREAREEREIEREEHREPADEQPRACPMIESQPQRERSLRMYGTIRRRV